MENIWSDWIAVALAVPLFYALESVLDVFFVGRKIYRDSVHATILCGLFSSVYLMVLLLEYRRFEMPEPAVLTACLVNGMVYIGHIYFYFKVLFKLNDASNLECFLGFSVILVPAFAFVFLGEKLALFQYIGIGISLIGVAGLFMLNVTARFFRQMLPAMCFTVVILSLTFIVQDEIYQHTNFYTGLTLFLAGQLIASLVIWKMSRCQITFRQTYRFGPLFILSQILGVAAVIFSQRAINISPSVTFVVAIETTTPIFIMLFSFLAIPVLSFIRGRECLSIPILRLQLNKMSYKLVAFVCLLTGVVLTSSPDVVKNFVMPNIQAIAGNFD